MTGPGSNSAWPIRGPTEPSRLNNLEPIGTTTPHVESLTSYFKRLSWSHCLSPGRLFAAVIAPLLNKAYLSNAHNRAVWLSRSLRARAAAINGTGLIALEWTILLEQLTVRQGLRSLTLLPWAGTLSQRNLLRSGRAWCPVCIETRHSEHLPLYEPLLWSIRSVTRCVIHNVPLISNCPRCKNALHWLSQNTRPGFCDACGQWLGLCSPHRPLSQTRSRDRELSHANMVGELLANSSLVGSFAHSTLSTAMASLISDGAGKNASHFALRVGRNKSTICGWVHGSRIPLPHLLDISAQLQTTPLKFLSGPPALLNTDNSRKQLSKRKSAEVARHSFDRKKALAGLQKALASASPPRSMQHVARTLRLDKRILYRHFPQLCKDIAAQARKHRRTRAA